MNAFKWAPSIALGIAGLGADVSGYQNITLAYFLWFSAIVLLALPLWPYLKRMRISLAPLELSSNSSMKESDTFPIEGFISIRSAASSLFKAFPNRYLLERAHDVMAGTANDVSDDRDLDLLKRIARYIAKNIPIHGKNVTTGVFEKINHIHMFGFENDLTTMKHHWYDASPGGRYVDIGVRIDEFEAFEQEEGMHESFREKPEIGDT